LLAPALEKSSPGKKSPGKKGKRTAGIEKPACVASVRVHKTNSARLVNNDGMQIAHSPQQDLETLCGACM
jgi:hypothetical protein